MSVLKSRSRMVTFRVSADEYDLLARSCVTRGARSMSDFARAAVLERMQMASTPAGTLSGDLTTLTAELIDLDASLREMRNQLRRVLGPAIAHDRSRAPGNAKQVQSKSGEVE